MSMAAEPWVNVYTPITIQGYIPSSPDYYSNNSNNNNKATLIIGKREDYEIQTTELQLNIMNTNIKHYLV